MKPNPHSNTVRRAALPEILFVPDLALALGLPEETVEAHVLDARYGPCFLVAGRPAVLREHLMETLRARAICADVSRKDVDSSRGGAA